MPKTHASFVSKAVSVIVVPSQMAGSCVSSSEMEQPRTDDNGAAQNEGRSLVDSYQGKRTLLARRGSPSSSAVPAKSEENVCMTATDHAASPPEIAESFVTGPQASHSKARPRIPDQACERSEEESTIAACKSARLIPRLPFGGEDRVRCF